MRKLGIDYGDVRIGIAVSDPMGIIANGLETYTCKEEKEDILHIVDIIKKQQADTVVIGLPKNMDGTEGERALKTRAFGDKLNEACIKENISIKIKYMDERLSSVSAEKFLIESDMRRDKRKTVIDRVAAAIVLQNYLDIFR